MVPTILAPRRLMGKHCQEFKVNIAALCRLQLWSPGQPWLPSANYILKITTTKERKYSCDIFYYNRNHTSKENLKIQATVLVSIKGYVLRNSIKWKGKNKLQKKLSCFVIQRDEAIKILGWEKSFQPIWKIGKLSPKSAI